MSTQEKKTLYFLFIPAKRIDLPIKNMVQHCGPVNNTAAKSDNRLKKNKRAI